jgi:signal transduction histidine kinase
VQVLLNLLKNAEEATGPSGRIRISVEQTADLGVLRVEDSGPGIPAENRERIFEPYFTTKLGGSGLGLAIARRICQEQGGELRLARERRPGWGTAFVVELPREGKPKSVRGTTRNPSSDLSP